MKKLLAAIGHTIATVWFAALTSLSGAILFGSISAVLCAFAAALAGHESVMATVWQAAILGGGIGALLAHVLPFVQNPTLKLEDKPAAKPH